MAVTAGPGDTYEIDGRAVACPFCRGKAFEKRRGVLDTRGMTFLGLSWANRGSTELICRACGYLLTFADPR